MSTTFTRHLVFPAKAEPYNYGHDVVLDDLLTEHLVIMWGLDEDESYVARRQAERDGDRWMVVSVESTESVAALESRLTYQRDRLSSGGYVSFPSRERYKSTVTDDFRYESIELVAS